MPEVRGYRVDPLDVPRLIGEIRGHPIVLLRADRVYGRGHIEHAARLAARAVLEGRARTADAATETMLYAAGERQIQRALALLGLHGGAREVAAIAWDVAFLDALAAREGWRRDDDVLAGDDATLDALGIDAAERAIVPREKWSDLVLEKVALVDVLKG